MTPENRIDKAIDRLLAPPGTRESMRKVMREIMRESFAQGYNEHAEDLGGSHPATSNIEPRDLFAAVAALAGLLSAVPERVPGAAYDYADSVMQERKNYQ